MRPGCALFTAHFMNSSATRSRARVAYSLGDRARHRGGRRVDGQIEAAGELHPAQHAQGVFGKGIAGGAQDAVVEIHLAAEEVPHFAGERVEAHGVDGEVAAGGGFARRDGCVELRAKIAVAGAGFAVAAGDAEVACVKAGPGKFHHAEALAYQIHAPAAGQKRGQIIVGNAVDFDVEVLRLEAQQGIAHRSAHHHGAEAGLAQLAHDPFERNW